MAQQQIITCGPFAFMWLMFCSCIYYAICALIFRGRILSGEQEPRATIKAPKRHNRLRILYVLVTTRLLGE